MNVHKLALAVDIFWLQTHDFTHPKTRGISDHQYQPVLDIPDNFKQGLDFFGGQNHGKLVSHLRSHEIFDNERTFVQLNIKKSYRIQHLIDCAGGQSPDVDLV
jgi:hypothetical protein